MLTPETLAWVLNLEVRTMRDWNRRRVIPFHKMGRKIIRYQAADVFAFLMRTRHARARLPVARPEPGASEDLELWERMERLIRAVLAQEGGRPIVLPQPDGKEAA